MVQRTPGDIGSSFEIPSPLPISLGFIARKWSAKPQLPAGMKLGIKMTVGLFEAAPCEPLGVPRNA